MRRLRGLKSLVHDAIDKTVDLVGEGHESTARNVMRVTDHVPDIAEDARRINAWREVGTRGVLGAIKASNRLVQKATDVALDVAEKVAAPSGVMREEPVPMRSDAMSREGLKASWVKDAAIAAVNAAVGDHLHSQGNGLALAMEMRVSDRYVMPDETDWKGVRRIAVYVHGLGTTEWSWCLESAAYHGDAAMNFGVMLERDLGIRPVFIRYNTGQHVSQNGRQLAILLETLARSAPDLEELILIGHSMGGLVVRSACHYGQTQEALWVQKTQRVFCLGSPHRGAPLEKFGNVVTGVLGAIDLPGTLIVARILEGRSAGIKDLRHGALVDEDWLGKDPDALLDEGRALVPLLPHIRYHFVSATITQDPTHPLGQLIGDILVREGSAQGPKVEPESRTFAIETARFGGVLHHQLQNHPGVYEVIRNACTPADVAEGIGLSEAADSEARDTSQGTRPTRQ
jgi:pimeloyl-ACP methyl ester carboxylesterase